MGKIKALLLDVGGVMMTNGWDTALRTKTCEAFNLELDEVTARHRLIFDTFETGKLTFDEYLTHIIFYEKRPFTLVEVKEFILNAVQPFEEMMNWLQEVKKEHNLKLGVVSNEGRELAEDRFKRFELTAFIDFFIASGFVHLRKPDPDIYKLAVDMLQVPLDEIVYIDDRKQLIDIAAGFGLQGIHHQGVESTKAAFKKLM